MLIQSGILHTCFYVPFASSVYMRLSRFSDIGLRALLLLAARPGRVVATTDLARSLRVSRDHLSKCLQTLQTIGAVRSTRGRGGGFAMHAAPTSLRLGTLIKRLEPSLALAECFEPQSSCPLTGRCRLAGVLTEAQSSFFDTLDYYTLADLVAADEKTLVQIGGLDANSH